MIESLLLACFFTYLIEMVLAKRRRNERNADIERAYLSGIHNANRVHRELGVLPHGEARH